MIGSDTSKELVSISQERRLEACVADMINLPYRSEIFDSVLCIAVLHHISTSERRLQAIRECMRVVKVGGDALFYAWALEQKLDEIEKPDGAKSQRVVQEGVSGHRFAEPDNLVPWHLKRHQKKGEKPTEDELQAAAEEAQRAFVAEHATFDKEKNAFVFMRYCHVYRQGELEELVKQLEPAVKLVRVYFDTGNWAMILRKDSSF